MIKLLLLLVFLLVFLRPHPEMFGSFLAVYLADLAIIYFLILAIVVAGYRRSLPSKVTQWIAMGVICLTVLYITLFSRSEVVLVIEATKIAYYFFFVAVILYVFTGSAMRARRQFNRTLDVMVVLLSMIAAIQLFEVDIINNFVHSIWGTAKLRGLSSSSPRVYSSFYNANWFGLVVAMLLVMYARRIMLFRRIRRSDWVLAVLCLCMLLASGSRSGLLAMIIALMILFGERLLHMRTLTVSIRPMLLLVVVGVLFFAFLPELLEHKRLAEVIVFITSGDLSSIPSAATRVDLWSQAVNVIVKNPLFGTGEYWDDHSPHNSFLYMMLLFGMVGAMIVMLVLWVSIIALAKGFGSRRIPLPLVSALLVGSFTAEFFFATQVMLAFFLILACWHEDDFVHRELDLHGVGA